MSIFVNKWIHYTKKGGSEVYITNGHYHFFLGDAWKFENNKSNVCTKIQKDLIKNAKDLCKSLNNRKELSEYSHVEIFDEFVQRFKCLLINK